MAKATTLADTAPAPAETEPTQDTGSVFDMLGTPEAPAQGAETKPVETDTNALGEETPGAPPAQAADTGAFDPEAFAAENDLDPRLVKGCTTEGEALKRVSQRLRNREKLHDRLSAEERERIRQEALAEAKPAEVPGAKPADDVDRFLSFYTADPAKGEQWVQEQMDQRPAQTVALIARAAVREEVAGLRKELGEARKTAETARQTATTRPLETEFRKFAAAHSDFDDEAADRMREVGTDLGVDLETDDRFALEDVYALSQLRETSELLYDRTVGLMRRGKTFADSKKIAGEEGGAQAEQKADDVRALAATAAAPGAGGGGGTRPANKERRLLRDINIP